MYGCESWTIKKAECRRIDAFELWCWRRLLRVPWSARRPVHPKGNQSWVFIGRTDVEAEAPIFWPELTHLKRPWCWERLKAGGEGDDRRWDGWVTSLTQCIWVWVNSRSWWWTWRPGMLQSMGLQSQTRLNDWTELNWLKRCSKSCILTNSQLGDSSCLRMISSQRQGIMNSSSFYSLPIS